VFYSHKKIIQAIEKNGGIAMMHCWTTFKINFEFDFKTSAQEATM
jgi:hypothetical protein